MLDMAGKGSKARPLSVPKAEFDNNFDRIFGNKKKTDTELFDEKVVMKNEYFDLDIDPENPDQVK
jgi:hypothetical protein